MHNSSLCFALVSGLQMCATFTIVFSIGLSLSVVCEINYGVLHLFIVVIFVQILLLCVAQICG